MRSTVFKRLSLPENMSAEDKLKLCAAHINDLEAHLEVIIERVNRRITEVER